MQFVRRTFPRGVFHKERITLRVDQDILEYFRRGGRGYQTRINAVLRAYVQMQTGNPPNRIRRALKFDTARLPCYPRQLIE